LHRNSGLPELRSIMRRKSGKPDCGVKPGNDPLRPVGLTVGCPPFGVIAA